MVKLLGLIGAGLLLTACGKYTPLEAYDELVNQADCVVWGNECYKIRNGKDGTNGKDGINGSAGSTGSDGARGSDGIDGLDGKDGVDGVAGTAGKDGATGAQGGTGATGATGAVGATGAKGDKGAKGNTGATGPASTNPLDIVQIIDPCGDGPGFDEVLLKLRNGTILAHFTDGSREYMTQLSPGAYRTADAQKCRFNVHSNGTITYP